MSLFTPFKLGRITLSNRVVMAPMTRSRATDGLPNDLIREHYTQRASAGLIITEGTAPTPEGLGYARIPGLFDAAQVAGWRAVTDAVHAAGGHIFAQLMHVGRIGHPANMPAGARLLAPSAVKAAGEMYTDAEGMQPFPTPAAMTTDEVEATRDAIAESARNAIAAGFDGVELHGANGYLLEQFLNPNTNQRTDRYGGSVENRARFVIELAQATADAIGADRVGIRLSPFNTFNDMAVYDDTVAQYAAVAAGLKGLAYLHTIRNPNAGFPAALEAMRDAFGGPIILNGGFGAADGAAAVEGGQADLISFGRPFIPNPDLVARLKTGAELANPDYGTFYTPGAKGYTDYPALGAG